MSASAHHNSTPDWQFRITDRDGGVLHGAAVLVAPDQVLTCAHVVRAANGEGGPGSRVRLDAPRHGGAWHAGAQVLESGWWWEDGPPWDAALLRLDTPAPAPPAPLGGAVPSGGGVAPGAPGPTGVPWGATGAPPRPEDGPWPAGGAVQDPHALHGRTVRILGFPHARAGRWLTGVVRGTGGARPEFVQIDIDPTGPVTVTRGFSGSGVRDHDGTLLGIVREAGANGRLAWMIPVTAVPGLHPVSPVRPGGPTHPTSHAPPVTHTRPDSPEQPGSATYPTHHTQPEVSAYTAHPVHPARPVNHTHPPGPAPARRPAPQARPAPDLDHEHLHTLAVAVSDLETVASREVRALFVSALDPRLRRRIDAGAVPAVFAHDLLLRAHRDYDILGEVLDRLAAWEEASAPMRRVREAAAPLLRGCGDT